MTDIPLVDVPLGIIYRKANVCAWRYGDGSVRFQTDVGTPIGKVASASDGDAAEITTMLVEMFWLGAVHGDDRGRVPTHATPRTTARPSPEPAQAVPQVAPVSSLPNPLSIIQ